MCPAKDEGKLQTHQLSTRFQRNFELNFLPNVSTLLQEICEWLIVQLIYSEFFTHLTPRGD